MTQICLGGMIYDPRKNKGVRRKFLPEPNPTKVDMLKDSTIFDVFQKSIELYYKEFSDVKINDVMLADSVGNMIHVDDLSGWKLSDYYSRNQFVPSRRKLYTMIYLPNNNKVK